MLRRGYPYIRLISGGVRHQLEVRRQHAHNRVAEVVQRDGLTENIGLATQAILPGAIAQNRHEIFAHLVLFVVEAPAEFHADAQ
jgi:hypothetical protein